MRYTKSALLAACWISAAGAGTTPNAPVSPIQHVIVIMQENRSFDTYFGTYPKANGLPAGVCVPIDTAKPNKGCVAPFHDVHDVNGGGPHRAIDAKTDIDDGITTTRLDGFVTAQNTASTHCTSNSNAPNCASDDDGVDRHDVMGYHTADEIPNYWAYAENFVLQDEKFEAVRSWSLPSHLQMTSEWVALCTNPKLASTCQSTVDGHDPTSTTSYPWANLFQLLDLHGVSWKYYLDDGAAPDCEDGAMACPPSPQKHKVASYWNPPPLFGSVQAQGSAYLQLHDPGLAQFYTDVARRTLPQVSWIVPSEPYSEHPPSGVTAGMEYVTALVNAIMDSPYWGNTAIFVSWDDWGGFYDHVAPPNVDRNGDHGTPIQGYGIRVPGLMISAFAKQGFIDHAVLSDDSYATFIEDLFMGGARLDPAALGIPDARPSIRDALTSVTFPDGTTAPIGDLRDEFDFKQAPRPPVVLSTHIPTRIAVTCRKDGKVTDKCTQTTVTVSWEPVKSKTVPGPFSYRVLRDGVELLACNGRATSCTDLPGAGVHFYRARSVDAFHVQSPLSAAAEADVP